MQRHFFTHHGLKLSYLDSGGDAPLLIALHAHWMEASTFTSLASALPQWRVVALDQRGHGYSDHASAYTRDDYLDDLSGLFDHLKVKAPVVLLGNSLGGINAYHFAALYPERVRAMIIEDIGVDISVDVSFSLAWGGLFKTYEDLANCVGPRFLTYLEDSFRQTEEGWKLAFNPNDMMTSHNLVQGDHWKEWLVSNCPALVIRGKDSRVTTQEHCEQMAQRRPNTILCTLEGGHVLHIENPAAFMEAVNEFLKGVCP
jgi:esterase